MEFLRQMQLLNETQNKEVLELQKQQTDYFKGFMDEWKEYLQEEEEEANQNLESLFAAQEQDIVNVRDQVMNKFHAFTHSKQWCTWKAQEQRHFSVKEYILAEQFKLKCEELDQRERDDHAVGIQVTVDKEVEKIKKLHVK